MAGVATEAGVILDMPGDTLDTGDLDGDILVTGDLATDTAITITLTITEEEDLPHTMAEETMPLTGTTAPIEIIQLTEVLQTDKIVFLTTEEVLL